MRWPQPIITDSGGFQVFSMGHGNVADEIKGRGQLGATSARWRPRHRGGRGRVPLLPIDGSERFLSPETSMEVQAALGSDIALVFDECTPFHVTRDYTARSTERTHRWLERCLRWHDRHGPADQLVYGIVQGGVEPDLRRESAQTVAASAAPGVAIGGTLGRDKAQMYEVVGWATAELERHGSRQARATCSVSARSTTSIAGRRARHRHVRLRDADPPGPPRGRAGAGPRSAAGDWISPVAAIAPRPSRSSRAAGARPARPGFSRAYLHHLLRSGELTGLRLLTLHNLSFIAAVMDDLRAGIEAGRLAEVPPRCSPEPVPGAAAAPLLRVLADQVWN